MDYKQELITTIHDFGCNLKLLEEKMLALSEQSSTAVVIPALYDELERPALTIIRDRLKQCAFIKTVIVCLYADTLAQYTRAVEFFESLPQPTLILWENGERVTRILETLRDRSLDLSSFRGKGRAVWLGLGVASLNAEAIALHDADIITYDRSYPLKLLYPLLEKEFGIAFNKAYYARISSESRQINGRVMRLFVTPLLTALTELFGYQNFLRYLHSFRYPLSGEFALNRDLALNIRIPSNWGLEIGLLAEVYRNVAQKRISQIDLGIFDHKHQAIGTSTQEGLQKMCRDILRSILRTLTEKEQVIITREHLHALRIKFRREAQDYTRQYFVDARFNQLNFDRHQEEVTTELFERVIAETGEDYFVNPAGAQIPDWTRALVVMPDLREQLRDAALTDAAEARALKVVHNDAIEEVA
ncbi:glucosyl-3-phosphoglycerate synthase [Candidatus Gracilibacteria bacterium]|nr:glucosyl-3-phosphoglycerate synthase [Candidatus Gracilibacteria bacterium]NJP19680.1 glucosyl-3-phosphoglycerate synthase [Hydrococcus sp. CRU_1_1]NJQ98066.1 glucosyl-3-phosphoglycerate synthase [Hydrococcus sp. CSU_1_8]